MAGDSSVSPDNIVVIDLIEDDSEQNHLKSVRKRLRSTPNTASAKKIKTERSTSATSVATAASLETATAQEDTTSDSNAEEIVVLDNRKAPPISYDPVSASNDNDDVQVVGTVGHIRLPHMRQHCTEKPFQSIANTTYAAQRGNNKNYCEDCYCYVCDVKASDCAVWDTHCNATDSGTLATFWHSERDKAKANGRPTGRAAAAPIAAAVARPVTASDPPAGFHHRFLCGIRSFVPTRTKTNRKACSRCYCFVCGVSATQCLRWHVTNRPSNWLRNHCNATSLHSGGGVHWNRLREEHLQRQQRRGMQRPPPRPSVTGCGPFAPDHQAAAQDVRLTQCRKCKWFNKFEHRNFEFYRLNKPGQPSTKRNCRIYGETTREIHPVGPMDWCHACGRVASERDFGKEQSEPFTPEPEDILLGTKEISFRLKSHDPRQMQKFRTKWQANQEWTYDENEMRDELFKHRLGNRPTLERILASIPVVKEDKIPDDGHSEQFSESRISVIETEAVLVDEHDDVLIEIFRNNRRFGHAARENGQWLHGDIRATWDSTAQKGTFSITVYIQCSSNASKSPPSSATRFLGAWFGVFPLQLPEVCGRLRPHYESPELGEYDRYNIGVPPFVLRGPELRDAEKLIEPERQALNEQLCEALQSREEIAVLKSGTGSPILGGHCTNETDFEGTLKRYVRECLPDLTGKAKTYTRERVWLNDGIASYHRRMKRDSRELTIVSKEHSISSNPGLAYDTIFSPGDFALATTHLCRDSKSLREQTCTLNGMMDHLENLGHASAPIVEGLTVELLPFQTQNLQWAIERETTVGGVQMFWWTKLPTVEHPGKELYYNLVSGRFASKKPDLVRGGIIADQMGLGKTVCSLSLILCNPAPTLPVSGSPVDSIATTPEMMASKKAFWDPGLYARKSALQKKWGSILSRGTLVVCNVSLVGQWIDEAKSKLKDPGLVYSYHGGNRKRDARILAQNAVVVTTYETLASDITYHKNKSKDKDNYCAPCEEIRWWRIICDESHVLRSSNNNKSTAIMNLTADNKWLVSGTPVNTSLNDLLNQLKFLGIEDAGQMMGVYRKSTFHHVGDTNSSSNGRSRRRYRYDESSDTGVPQVGHFTFLMRSIMMRHSQKQEYVGTSTTLMSLPPKTESVVAVEFSADDKKEYDALETAARAFYLNFKELHGHKLSKHTLVLRQKLTPLRVACAGGQVPIDDDSREKDDDDEDEEEHEEGHKKKKSPQKMSDFTYTSKLRKLVEELKRAREEDESAKSLVFSQFNSTLKWLQQELPKHGFQFRTLSGDMSMSKRSKALREFQNDPPTTIFLLSMRSGGVGLTLSQASKVFILEPCFNPALEAQAVGRVHRLGQKRSVEIVRLIMADSVEARMQKWLEKKYGNGHFEAEDEAAAGEENDDEEKKPAAKPMPELNVAVGSLKTDKAQMADKDFDLLFGVEDSVGSGEARDATDGDDMAITSATI